MKHKHGDDQGLSVPRCPKCNQPVVEQDWFDSMTATQRGLIAIMLLLLAARGLISVVADLWRLF